MEFKIITDLETLPTVIETNGDEIKAELEEKTKYYNALVVTADSIQSAKEDRANLNKLRTALEDRRKEIKKRCLAPYEAFEVKYKELLALIDKPILSIDTQIKAFDEKEIEEKYKKLEDYFYKVSSTLMSLPHTVKLETVLSPKWKNKTAKIGTLCEQMLNSLISINDDADEIKKLYSGEPFYSAVKMRFDETLSKADTLSYAAYLIQAEQKRAEEQKAQEQQTPEQPPQQPVQDVEPDAHEITPQPQETPQQPPVMLTGMFRVTGTKEQIIGLREYMKTNGISFEVVR